MASSFVSRLMALPQRYPYRFGLVMATGTAALSDATVQTMIENREQVDLARSGAFALFGFFYLGQVQYALYVKLFGRMFPNAFTFAAKPLRAKVKDPRGMLEWFAQVFIDLAIHRPLVYFPTVYAYKEMVLTNDKPDIMRAWQRYRENAYDDYRAMLKVWGPANFINFGFCPLYMRVPFTALVRYSWTFTLSLMRGGDISNSVQLAGDAVTGEAFRILEEGLEEMSFKSSMELEKDMSHVVITACGPDRVGHVTALAKAVQDLDGNVTLSRMVRLGQEFIMMVHVSVPHHKKRLLIQGLRKNEELKSLNIVTSGLSRKQTGTFQPPTAGLRIKCIGKDRPGMLLIISEKISQKGMNVENITTEIVVTKSGQRNFVVTADCVTPFDMGKEHLDNLANDFSSLKDELELDIMDVRLRKFKN